MVQVIFLYAPKEGECRIGKVQREVQPFFGHVALYYASEQNGQRANWKEEADRGGDEKQWQNVFQFTANVSAVEWPLVVIPMERIEPLMEKFPNDTTAGGEAAVKNVAVKEIFDESPSDTAREEESHCDPPVLCPR